MFELPAGTLAELSDYNVAVSEHLDVKVDVQTWLRRVSRLENYVHEERKDLHRAR